MRYIVKVKLKPDKKRDLRHAIETGCFAEGSLPDVNTSVIFNKDDNLKTVALVGL